MLVHNECDGSALNNWEKKLVNNRQEAAASKSSAKFEKWLNKGEANNKVYFGIEGDQKTYTGITKQSLEKRLSQHNSPLNVHQKNFDRLALVEDGLTRNQARAIEQYYIDSGINKRNIINSISPKHRFYNQARNWAEGYLGVK